MCVCSPFTHLLQKGIEACALFLQHHMSRGGGGGHWKESPKKNAMNELQDKLMTLRLREAQAQAELREVKLKSLQLDSQVTEVPL